MENFFYLQTFKCIIFQWPYSRALGIGSGENSVHAYLQQFLTLLTSNLLSVNLQVCPRLPFQVHKVPRLTYKKHACKAGKLMDLCLDLLRTQNSC